MQPYVSVFDFVTNLSIKRQSRNWQQSTTIRLLTIGILTLLSVI